MRPRKLIMENFGAYRARTEVDFTLLGTMFLVCGKTGSGKTTIFDALTYALYGKAPGARDGLESQLWSQHAKPGEVPLVEFEFSLGEAVYRIVRRPPYKRAKRGGGLIEIPSEAHADRFDMGSWITAAQGIREVNQYVELEVGLTAEEFSRIILLPQGEFQRFLEMDSGERVKVLEKLFPVELHDRTTELARERVKVAKQRASDLDSEIARLSGEAGQDPAATVVQYESDLARMVEELSASLTGVSSARSTLDLGRKEADRIARRRRALAELAALEARIPGMEALAFRLEEARKAATVLPAIRSEEAARKQQEKAALRTRDFGARLATLEKRRPQIESLRLELAQKESGASALDARIGRLQGALAAWERAQTAETAWKETEARVEAAAQRLELARSARVKIEQRSAALVIAPEEESRLRSQVEAERALEEQTRRRLASLIELQGLLTSRIQSLTQLSIAQTALDAANALFATARERHEAAEALASADLAASLASGLQEGGPCPVCGSTSHPAPARLGAHAPQAKERERLRSQAEAARKKAEEAGAGVEACRAILEERSRTLVSACGAFMAAAPVFSSAHDNPQAQNPQAFSIDQSLARSAAGDLDALGPALFATALPDAELEAREAGQALAQARAHIEELEAQRRLLASLQVELESAKQLEMSATAAIAEARTESASRSAMLEESRRSAGGIDPGPELEALRAEASRLRAWLAESRSEAERWERSVGEVVAALAGARSAEAETRAAASEAAGALSESLELRGFGSSLEAQAASLPEADVLRGDKELRAHAEALSGARSAVAALEALGSRSGAPGNPAPEEEEPDLAALEAALRAAEARHVELNEEAHRLSSRLAQARSMLETLGKKRAEADRLRQDSSSLYELSELLSGNIAGRRLPFKTFALAFHFRAVVENAGRRLAEMSEGRYSLVAEEGSARGQGRVGLEIAVRDAYTGQTRPAGTLSGGERFLTSISLAFGLSDTIVRRAGGVNLDAVFIDEGFGSLDEEALDRAISVLDRMRGTRIIGLVSHVPELRSRIPSQIVVEKGRDGSSLGIVPG